MAILVYGAVNPDLVHRVDRLPGPGDDIRSTSWRITWGGKAANAAVALATWGVNARLTGLVIGCDALGDALVEALERFDLDLFLLERSGDEPTRHCLILVEPGGDRTIVCTGYEGARWSEIYEWDEVEVVLLDGFAGDAAAVVGSTVRSSTPGWPTGWCGPPTSTRWRRPGHRVPVSPC
jgi:ribokinase